MPRYVYVCAVPFNLSVTINLSTAPIAAEMPNLRVFVCRCACLCS